MRLKQNPDVINTGFYFMTNYQFQINTGNLMLLYHLS